MATTNSAEAPESAGLFGGIRAISRPSLLAFGVGVLAVLSGMATYATVMGFVPYTPTPAVLVGLLIINLTLGLTLGALIAWRLTRLWSARRSGIAGARLHVRLVAMFSLIAVVPAVFVAIFAAVTLNLGVEAWFSSRVQTALDNAMNIARQYMVSSARGIIIDAGTMEEAMERDPTIFDSQKQLITGRMFAKLEGMTSARGLVGSIVVDSHGAELGRSSAIAYSRALRP